MAHFGVHIARVRFFVFLLSCGLNCYRFLFYSHSIFCCVFLGQKELFGKDAWKYINYVECSPKGYRSQFALCMDEGVDGYPTWKFGNGKSQGGEMELIEIAKLSGFLKKKGAKSFDASLEVGVPSLGGGECQ